MVSYWSLSDIVSSSLQDSSQYSGQLNFAVVWMVFTSPFISKSSSPLVTVPWAPITIGITITFMFHIFFSSQAKSWYLSFFLFSFNFNLWSAQTAKSTTRQVLFFVDYLVCWLSFLLTISKSGCLAKIWWSIYISKSQSILCISFSQIDSILLSPHHFLNNFLAISSSVLQLSFFLFFFLFHEYHILWKLVYTKLMTF